MNMTAELPKIDVPVYKVKLPSNGKEIHVRPFNVREEKLLLIALESKSKEDIIDTVKQVLSNCVIKGNVDIDRLPFFDIDFLFIFLRAKSVGESVTVTLTCHNILDSGKQCNHTFETQMNINNCELVQDDGIPSDIKLDKTSGVMMKYPSYSLIKSLDEVPEIDKRTIIIINSIEHIYDKSGVYSSKDYSTQQLKDFVEGLTEENYKKLERFIDNFPTFLVKIEADCPACKYHHVVRYTDFIDFFS